MTSELQRLVDALGMRLRRNVTIDDSRLRQLAFSSHEFGGVDELREQSILRREVPAGAAEWTWASGARTAEGPFRPPRAPEIGASTQRVCIPVRQQGNLLGFVWVLEGDDPLDDTVLSTVMESIDTIGVVIQRDLLVEELHRSRARELARDLVVPHDAHTREHAATELVENDLFVASEPVVAIVVTLHEDQRDLLDNERDLLASWFDRATCRISERRHVSLVRRNHGLLIASERDPLIAGRAKLDLARELMKNASRDLVDIAPRGGIGSVVPGLHDLHRSYQQAQRTARVSRLIPGLGDVTSFDDLGVYGVLARIPAEELTDQILPASLRTLLDSGSKGEQLASTLEVFLDNAGDVQASAEQLFVHRTTLYYRLQRIEELTGADLANGEERLALHLGLKVARLIGRRDLDLGQ